MSVSSSSSISLAIKIAEDKLSAWIEVSSQLAAADLTIEAIHAALKAHEIVMDDIVAERVNAIVADPEEALAQADDDRILVAEGLPPVNAVPESFTWADEHLGLDLPDPEERERIDYFKVQHIRTYDADIDLGLLTPFKPGRTGHDVLGHELRPVSASHEHIEVGAGLKREMKPDGAHLITTAAGRVFSRDERMWLEEVLSIPDDVDFKTGSIDSKIAINVDGAIRENFEVRTPSALVVQGTIEAANVEAGGDVTCMKGIVGQPGKGFVKSGGTLTVRFINEASVFADEGVRVNRSAMNSDLSTQKEICITHGALVGGHSYAREAIVVKSLGNRAAVPTTVVCGISPQVLAKCKLIEDEIKSREETAERIRTKMAPFLAALKRLNPTQREQVTALMAQADEITLSVDELSRQRKALMADAAQPQGAQVVVHDRVHAGVTLIFGQRETRIKHDLIGPVRITERKIDGAVHIIAINMNSGSVTPLKMRAVDLSHYLSEAAGETEDAGS